MKLTTPPLVLDLEAAYRKYYLNADALKLFMGIILWVVAFLGFLFSDYLLYGFTRPFLPLLVLRLGYALFCGYLLVLLRRSTLTPRVYDRIALAWGLVTELASLGVCLLRPRSDLSVLILDLVGVFSFYVFISSSLLYRIIPAVSLTVIDLLLIILYKQGIPPQVALALAFSFTITNLVGIIFSRSFYGIRRGEFLARHEEDRIRAELTRLAVTDPLTGVFNRRRLLDLAGQALYRHRRYGRPFSIVIMDLDDFKVINDTFGHLQGDAALLEFTRIVTAQKREGDAFGRIGGDEFCLLLPETELASAAVLAGRILDNCRQIVLENGVNRLQLTTSIGISQGQEGDQTLDAVLARADAALYQAKHKGRNRFELN